MRVYNVKQDWMLYLDGAVLLENTSVTCNVVAFAEGLKSKHSIPDEKDFRRTSGLGLCKQAVLGVTTQHWTMRCPCTQECLLFFSKMNVNGNLPHAPFHFATNASREQTTSSPLLTCCRLTLTSSQAHQQVGNHHVYKKEHKKRSGYLPELIAGIRQGKLVLLLGFPEFLSQALLDGVPEDGFAFIIRHRRHDALHVFHRELHRSLVPATHRPHELHRVKRLNLAVGQCHL
jgi:hypothetical protein